MRGTNKCLTAIILALFFSACSLEGNNVSGPSGKKPAGNGTQPQTTYIVSFDANGANGTAPDSQSGEAGSSIVLPNQNGLSKNASNFGGWSQFADGTGDKYSPGSSFTVPNRDITLYAFWNTSVETYKVGFDTNGGNGTAPAAQTVQAGSSITLPSGSGISKNGESFGGWNTEPSGNGINHSAGSSYTPGGNITLYAMWLPAEAMFTVTFSVNGGSGTAPTAQTVQAGFPITLPSGGGLSKSGHTFGGWNANASGTGATYGAGASYTPTGNVTLYAKWDTATATYIVTFNANGGSGTAPGAQTVQAGSSIVLPGGSGLSKSGFVFGGWNTNAAGTGTTYEPDFSYKPTGNIILYAKWDTASVPIPEMVWINAGTFTMGSPSSEPGRLGDETQHQVTLTKGFYMGIYPVTQTQYQAVMGRNPSYFTGDNLPVERVSWYDAVEFCNALSQREGLSPAYAIDKNRNDPNNIDDYDDVRWVVTLNPSATGYRLPTEAEWEYACRAGTTTAFNWGTNYISSTHANYKASEVDANNLSAGTNLGRTTAVGSYAPNAWGLYDMLGNVWEWCWDWNGRYMSGAQTDPTGTVSGAGRAKRGGSWDWGGRYARSACRSSNFPSPGYSNIGFRLVRP